MIVARRSANSSASKTSLLRLSHVDDYLITTSSDQIFELFMTNVEKALDVDKRGTPRKFLGIESTPKTEFKEWNRGRNNR
jgi:hypothetical protein